MTTHAMTAHEIVGVLLCASLTASPPARAVEPTTPAPEAPARVSAGADGFVLQAGDGAWRLRVGGYAQFDGRFYAGDGSDTATDTFVLRRVRPVVQGTVGKLFDFYLNPDFAGGTTVLQDAYLDVRATPKLRVRVGKFKVPFGLERLQSGAGLLFVERALPTSIAPNRDLGLQLHGEWAGGVLQYQAGVFNGVVDGGSADADTNDGKDLAARVFVQPWKRGTTKALAKLGLGLAITRGEQSGALPSYRSGGQLAFFSYAAGVSADGRRARLSPQVQWAHARLGLFAEYARSTQDVRRGADLVRVTNRAWQAAAALTLTGEAAAPGSVTPRRPFDPHNGQWGALELAARWNELTIDDAVFRRDLADPARAAREARAWGLGLNWYLNRNVKQSVGFEHTSFRGGAAAGADRRAENALLVRSQVSF